MKRHKRAAAHTFKKSYPEVFLDSFLSVKLGRNSVEIAGDARNSLAIWFNRGLAWIGTFAKTRGLMLQ